MESLAESCEKQNYEKKSWAEEYPPKVKAMFEAVLDLFASGREPGTLKVEEITQRAGIGKGTAYEYFSSKEEIVVGALNYEAERLMSNIYGLLESRKNFKEIIMTGLDMLESTFIKDRGFKVISRIMSDETLSEKNVLTEIEKHKENCNLAADLIEGIAKRARQEGAIQETDTYKIQSAIISQIIWYAIYVTNQEKYANIEKQTAKQNAYENMLKLLNET